MKESPSGSTKPAGADGDLKSERIGARLTDTQIDIRLSALPGWEVVDGESTLRRTVELPTLRVALAFVAYVVEVAEVMDHHPGIQVEGGTVTLTLTTHSAGGLTDHDFALATRIRT